MFTVTADPDRNRLYVTLGGHMEASERQEATKAIMAEAAKLAQGFDMVNDISGLHPSDKDGFKDLLRAKAALKLKGVGHIIRVVKIALTRLQLQRISEDAGYHEDYAGSIEEADSMLDAMKAEAAPES